MPKKYVYFFGGGVAEGNESMKALLGGKGANLAEMAGRKLKLPVPPGFTITTEVCNYYFKNKKTFPPGLEEQVNKALKRVEFLTGKKFGDPENPLLVSVRSGARKSMPGMMETVLNVGLCDKTLPGLINKTKNERFVYDAYRRLIMMYSDVVMEKAAGLEPKGEGIRKHLENKMNEMKNKKNYKDDTELTSSDLKELVEVFKKEVKDYFGKEFPQDPYEQLWSAIAAVFESWFGKKATSYRRIENIPDDWGTACNVQTMVFGNTGNRSATGVAFTRNPATGDNIFYGEYLINAQGEDVVAGIRTPAPINEVSKTEKSKEEKTLAEYMPECYLQLEDIRKRLERHYKDMMDIEFTIEDGRLYMLQCRVGKRTGLAAVKIAVDMVREKLISKKEAINRITYEQLNQILHPIIDPSEESRAKPIAKGLPAGPGAATGRIVFTASDAVNTPGDTILVREETNPEDIDGMRAARGILTAKGGMTSHAALVARSWGKCCIVGCSKIEIDIENRAFTVDGRIFKEGDWITLNGSTGAVYEGRLKLVDPTQTQILKDFLSMCATLKPIGVRANADTPQDAKVAREFGAEGIGLFRIEHMFYGEGSAEPLFILRKLIMSESSEERTKICDELFPYMKEDIKNTLKVMKGLPVTIRLLDPPLHEFVPRSETEIERLIKAVGITREEFEKRASRLKETNPMMGHRGVRLGISYPEITRMQARAIFVAAAELIKYGIKAIPEIMIPVVATVEEILHQKKIILEVYDEVRNKFRVKIPLSIGTMIEVPRAAIIAGEIAKHVDFFSFGTNDLTQMGFGISRDDVGSFIGKYIEEKIIAYDPFEKLDPGIGELVRIASRLGRKVNKKLKLGVCGEHGGDPDSVLFFYKTGLNYVSCSPYRVPVAILTLAKAAT